MVSTPKVIGLMSCGFLLCLGLSNAAPAVAADEGHQRQKDGPRVGGQGGAPAEGQALGGAKAGTPHARQKDGPRVGGQGAAPDASAQADGASTPHARQKDGPRVGGQGGQP